MYQVEANTTANVLQIDLSGRMDRAEIETAADEAVSAAERLDEGFHIVNDISGFKPPSPEAAKPIKRAQGKLKAMGVDRVVRVADEETSQVVVNAFERRSRDVGYSGETAESIAEAKRALSERDVAGYASD